MGKLRKSGYGPNGYVPINLLKALILQTWHSLSDEGLEEALRVHLDFMVISGLQKAPDHTTLCRFRNLLMSQNLWDRLLNLINDQLENKGLKTLAGYGGVGKIRLRFQWICSHQFICDVSLHTLQKGLNFLNRIR